MVAGVGNGETRKNPRPKNARTKATQAAFLAAFARWGYVGRACTAAGLDRDRPADWSKSDPEFAQAYEHVRDAVVEKLEIEADRRALRGVKREVYYKGKVCGFERQYSDTLLIFRLKALKPEVYRENFDVKQSGEVTSIIRIDAPPPPKSGGGPSRDSA